MTHLCAVAHTRGHLDGCDDDTCPGCRPALAADGLQVCGWHADRVHEALSGHQSLVSLWADVEDALTLRGRPAGARGSGRPLQVDLDSADWRSRVRACLVSWCLVLEEDFDVRLDGADDTIAWMADRVSRHATRLLASEHADQLCADLLGWVETSDDGATTRHDGLLHEGRRLAFRSSGQRVTIACPCGRRVTVPTDEDGKVDPAELLRCHGCGEEGVLAWWQARLVGDPQPMTLSALPDWIAAVHGIVVTKRLLRGWADEGHLTTVETAASSLGGRPRRLFDPVAVAAVVMARREVRTA